MSGDAIARASEGNSVKSGVLRLIGRIGVTAVLVVPSFAVVVGVGAFSHGSGLPLVAGDLDASAQTTGFNIAFASPPIASAGSIAPGGSVNFTLSSKFNGVAAPNSNVSITQTNGVSGDVTLVPSSQCGGQTQLPSQHGSYINCQTDSSGNLVLTYKAPLNLLQFGEADWQANASGSASAITHYVYCDVLRFSPSPIATPGMLLARATVQITLTSKAGLDQGIPNSNVYLSFNATFGGGTALVGTTQLTSSAQLFTTDGTGALQITYNAPATLPTSGQDSINVRDGGFSVGAGNSDTYSFGAAATTPVISIGNVAAFEADQQPGIPANFTVTVSPVQANPITIQYTALCGIGDKECGEDYRQITSPKSLTIAAGAKTAILRVGQYSYIGGKGDNDVAGETYSENFFLVISHPSAGVLGRSVGEGTLLPDIEAGQANVADLYVGNAGIVPVGDTVKRAVDFTVTLGALETSTTTFTYTTADGTAIAGVDYTAKTGTGTIAAGKDSFVITVLLNGNAPPLSPKTFTLTISNASDGSGPVTIGTATGTGTVLSS
jgi:hypothetical protein